MRHASRELVVLVRQQIAWLSIAVVVLIGYSVWQSYEGRVDLVDSQRAGCKRGQLDRQASAVGWRTAEHRALSQDQPQFARVYDRLATGYETRARIDCSAAFPSPSLLPF